jgi:hypothetical protein
VWLVVTRASPRPEPPADHALTPLNSGCLRGSRNLNANADDIVIRVRTGAPRNRPASSITFCIACLGAPQPSMIAPVLTAMVIAHRARRECVTRSGRVCEVAPASAITTARTLLVLFLRRIAVSFNSCDGGVPRPDFFAVLADA